MFSASLTSAAAGGGCASQPQPLPRAAGVGDSATGTLATAADVIEVPETPTVALLDRARVATGLPNPRGMHVQADGSLLVAVAGTGDPANPLSGGIVRLRDKDADGDFDDPGERSAILERQPSRNLLSLVRRDEVFGMAGLAEGGGMLLGSLADFGGPSKIFRIDGDTVSVWGDTHGNVNDLQYDARRSVWVAVASTTDEVVELLPGGRSQRLAKLAPLPSGQDAVPSNLRFDARSGDVLVSLFSGSPEGEEGGRGVELVPRSARIVSVHAETHAYTPVVVGLTVPTDLELLEDGTIFVLEFCDSFVEPVGTREQMFGAAPLHGGFRRFSGRLLRIDRSTRAVSVIAQGLDAPTNLTRAGKTLYISEGMGTPGRLIPGPDGAPLQLTGFIERITLP
ncbi:MAG: hypothetical protein ABW321_16290 [Polyangiales bacterium]